jgi:ABC-type proline/glycine betaine transport system ATPase subunit
MERGKSYAFCGTSGAGKSSILAVLQRFYNITSGSVTLDGKDIRSMDVKEYRSLMGYVSQEPVLFEETIRWNLLVRPFASACHWSKLTIRRVLSILRVSLKPIWSMLASRPGRYRLVVTPAPHADDAGFSTSSDLFLRVSRPTLD